MFVAPDCTVLTKRTLPQHLHFPISTFCRSFFFCSLYKREKLSVTKPNTEEFHNNQAPTVEAYTQ